MILKIIFTIIVLVHGLIHFLGFVKAFGLAEVPQLKQTISQFTGTIWLISGLAFLIVAITLWLYPDKWWQFGIIAVVISQIIIFTSWQDAKFGTVFNIIVLLVSILSYGSFSFERKYEKDVQSNLAITTFSSKDIITDADLFDLPLPVQRYLRYVGVINKPKVKNMRVVLQGQMRERGKDWFEFSTEQYNFFDNPTRLFFMKGRMFGINIPGYHRFADGKASMDIRLFGFFPVVQHSGDVMDKTETVTYFNDMCLLAPATLIDKRIKWEYIDERTVKAKFGNHDVAATLYFDDDGKLINFLSYDRTSVSDMKQYPFTTPVEKYKNFNGYNLAAEANAIWHYPDEQFVYGKFILKEIEYNVQLFK